MHRDADGYSFVRDAWGQAVVAGALTLIPPRNYLRWLRRALSWGLPATGAVAFGYFAAEPRNLARLGERFGAESEGTGGKAGAQGAVPEAGDSESLPPAKKVLIAGAVGLPIAAVATGLLAGAFWADEKIEHGLRRGHVPVPRVVMGIAAAAVTWWQVTSENKRSTSV